MVQGSAPVFPTVAAMTAADRRRITAGSVAMCGLAQVLRLQSAELRKRAAVAKANARALCEQTAALLRERAAVVQANADASTFKIIVRPSDGDLISGRQRPLIPAISARGDIDDRRSYHRALAVAATIIAPITLAAQLLAFWLLASV
jgi:hypothetical protein